MNLNGLTKTGGGETGKGLVAATKRTKGPVADDVDVRDQIGILVGGGYNGLHDETSQMAFQRIRDLVGAKKAQDLVSHIIIQNQRSDFKTMPPAERLQRFYDINSANPDTNSILTKMRGLGTGVLPGYTGSSYLQAQRQQGMSGEGIVGKIADYTKK